MLNVRFAEDRDFAAMARLHRQVIRHVNSKDYPADVIAVWSGRTNANKFRSSVDKCKRWVATINEKVVGFCDHNFECEIWGLYIHKDFHGQGVGSALITTAEESLRDQGCSQIHLKSTITARGFYEKHGYIMIKPDTDLIEGKEVPIFYMKKTLG